MGARLHAEAGQKLQMACVGRGSSECLSLEVFSRGKGSTSSLSSWKER